MTFKKGQSGNPGGRVKAAQEVRTLARSYSREAIERLVKIMRTRDDNVAVSACNAILDRGYGKPAQELNITTDNDAASMSRAELESSVRTILGTIGNAAGVGAPAESGIKPH